MKNRIIGNLIVFAMGLLSSQAVRAQGTLYVSSLGSPSAGAEAVGSDSSLAAIFATGSNPGGYALDSIQLAMAPASGTPHGFTVTLCSASVFAGAAPGASLGTLSGESDPVTGGVLTYTASDLMLSPSTMYYVVLTAETAIASGAYAWSVENSQPPAANGGWSASDYLITSSGGPFWEPIFTTPQYSITAAAVPEPGVFILLSCSGLFFIVWKVWRPQRSQT